MPICGADGTRGHSATSSMARMTPESKGYPPLHKTRNLTHLSKYVTPQKRPALDARHNCRPGRYTRYGAVHPLRGTTPLTWQYTSYVALHPLRGTTPLTWQYTSYVAVHLLRGTTPLTWQYTSYVAVHLLRGTTPEQRGCIAYISGAAHAYLVQRIGIGCSTLANMHNGGHKRSRTRTSTSRALIRQQGVATPPTAAPRV